MPTTRIVPRAGLPDAAFDVMAAGFPHETHETFRRFWDAHPDSTHAPVYDGERLVAHAGLITRRLYVGDAAIDAAYVEYVCAEPRRHGYGREAMRALAVETEGRGFPLAALATGSPEFYARLGWQTWRGPTAYRKDGAVILVPHETVMVLDLGANVDLDAQIETDWRSIGDIW